MRSGFIWLVVFGVLSLAPARSDAQQKGYIAETTTETTIRARPSDTGELTGTLPRGEKVVVSHAVGENWLAIQPTNGQLSWIRRTYIDEPEPPQTVFPRDAFTVSDTDIELFAGVMGTQSPFNITLTKIPEGTTVTMIGPPVQIKGIFWVPIKPVQDDFRYIPKSAVQPVPGASMPSFVVKSPSPVVKLPNNTTPESPPTGKITAAPPSETPKWDSSRGNVPGVITSNPRTLPPTINDPLWIQAEQAEARGDYDLAERHYRQVAANLAAQNGDNEKIKLCFERIHQVREKKRLNQRSSYNSERRTPALQTFGPAKLTPISTDFEGRKLYSLFTGDSRLYVISGSGVDLEAFRNREVEVSGTVRVEESLRKNNLMTVTKVTPIR
ncbi:MAG: SH3 domain-containing protein [Fimbriiglobus sp.]